MCLLVIHGRRHLRKTILSLESSCLENGNVQVNDFITTALTLFGIGSSCGSVEGRQRYSSKRSSVRGTMHLLGECLEICCTTVLGFIHTMTESNNSTVMISMLKHGVLLTGHSVGRVLEVWLFYHLCQGLVIFHAWPAFIAPCPAFNAKNIMAERII